MQRYRISKAPLGRTALALAAATLFTLTAAPRVARASMDGDGTAAVNPAAAMAGDDTMASADGAALTDLDVSLAAEERLAADKQVAPNTIRVDVRDGIVQLTGTVDNQLAYRRAARDAELAPGARSVVNDIVLVRPTNDDAATWGGISRALQLNPATAEHAFDVDVDGGAVTLRGTVDSLEERRIAEDVVAGVPGVVSVNDQTYVRFDAPRPDDELKADVQARLAENLELNADNIRVDVRHGTVTLQGAVGSDKQRELAIGAAKEAGAKQIDADALQAPWWVEDISHPDLVAAQDTSGLSRTIREAIARDRMSAGALPTVSVRDGVATLTGEVAGPAELQAVERDALDTVGVRAVKEDLRFEPIPLPDPTMHNSAAGKNVPVA